MAATLPVIAPAGSEQHRCHAFCDYIPATRSTWHHDDCPRQKMSDPLPVDPSLHTCHPACDYIFSFGIVHHPDCENRHSDGRLH